MVWVSRVRWSRSESELGEQRAEKSNDAPGRGDGTQHNTTYTREEEIEERIRYQVR